MFEYGLDLSTDRFAGQMQVSNWIPLQVATDIGPYSLEFGVAEVRGDPKEFSKKLFEWLKSVRMLL